MSTSRRVAALLLPFLLLSCGGDGTGVDESEVVASVTVTPSSSTIDLDETRQLTATARNAQGQVVDASVSWTTGDGVVASVSQTGLVTGLSPGTAVITATAGGESGTATVTVRDPEPPGAPSDVQAVPSSNTTADVTWSDNSDNEDEFRIERQAVSGATEAASAAQDFTEVGSVGADVTSFEDTGLDPETGYRYRVLACNENGCSGPSGSSEDVTTFATLAIETAALSDGVENEPYEATLVATGGDGTVSWSVSEATLPPGLALAGATGVISGTPETPGQYDFTVQAEGAGQTVTRALSITIAEQILPPVVTTGELPNGVVGLLYGEALTAEEGDGEYLWAHVAGDLPPGLALSADGVLSGVLTAAGSFGFTVEVTSADMTGSAELSIDVFDPLAITTGALPSGVLDTPYAESLTASGGDGSYTWTHTGGSLPDGLGLASDGSLDGTPSAVGTFDFTVTVSSADGQDAQKDLSITVHEQIQAPQVTTTELADGGVGAAYSQTLQATDGDGSYAWDLADGTLPDGLDLDAGTGEISGTPTTAGVSEITVRVTSAELTGTAELSITVHEALGVATAALPDSHEGAAYDETLNADGGNGEDTWSLESGDLPDGLALAADGTISGSVAAASPSPGAEGPQAVTGTFDFTVKVENTLGQEATRALSITIHAVLEITTTDLPDGEIGVAYGETLQATGGDGSNTWIVVSGALPDDLGLDTGSGQISGTPGASGTFNFTVDVNSGDGQTDQQALSITIAAAPVSITTTSLPDGEVDAPYSETLEATGGDGSYSWAHVAGDPLPDGLTLGSSTGEISGTPTTAGTANFTVEVTSGGQTDQQALSLTVTATPVVIETNFLAGGHPGAAYSDVVSVSGGDGSYAFSVTAGGLPDGLDIDPDDGSITGTPTTSGIAHFTVEVSSGGSSASHTYMLTISTVGAGGFNVFLHNVAGVLPSSAVQTALDAAVAKVEEVITGDIPSFTTSLFTEDFCDGWAVDFNGVTIDDVEVFMDIASIDGPGSVLASAGPCATAPRGGSTSMPILGMMTMDSDDLGGLDATQLRAVILHEMLHVKGIGTLWSNGGNDFVTGLGTSDPRYTGADGVSEYKALGGPDDDVPVYGTGSQGDGSYGVHWRESTFDTELMTPFSEGAGVSQPLSTITIGSLSDIGWTVDLGAAESYAIPSPPPPGAPPPESDGLHDTIWDGPVAVFDEDGALVTVIRPPE